MLTLSALHGVAGATTALALLAFGVTVLGIHALWRLRRDRLTLQAAQRFEAVDMTTVVKRHVPGDLQSNRADQEFILVGQSIARKVPRWIRVVVLSNVVTLSAGSVSWILIDRNWQHIVAAQLAEQAPKPVDALKAIAGVWGWRFEFLQSCSQNAHTIAVTDGNKRLSVQYTKPLWDGSQEVSQLEYTIVGVEPNKLVLESARYPKQIDPRRPPTKWYFMFSNADTYRIGRSDESRTTGDIVRCQ
jgi:hypothetical protein